MRAGKTALVVVECLRGGRAEQKREKKERELMDMDNSVVIVGCVCVGGRGYRGSKW